MNSPSIENLVISEKYDLTKLQKACVEYAIQQPLRILKMDTQYLDEVSEENLLQKYQEKCNLLDRENDARRNLITDIRRELKEFTYTPAHVDSCNGRSSEKRGFHGHRLWKVKCGTCLCEIIYQILEGDVDSRPRWHTATHPVKRSIC